MSAVNLFNKWFGSSTKVDELKPAPVVPVIYPTDARQNDALAKEAMKEAISHLGEKEASGRNDGPFVESIEGWFYGPRGAKTKAPWCAIFRSKCDADAAAKLNVTPMLPKTDSSSALYTFARKNNLLLLGPIPYCVGLMKGDGGSRGKTHHHTFRVVSVDLKLGTVRGIDGNWGNQVCYTEHRISDCDFVACC